MFEISSTGETTFVLRKTPIFSRNFWRPWRLLGQGPTAVCRAGPLEIRVGEESVAEEGINSVEEVHRSVHRGTQRYTEGDL